MFIFIESRNKHVNVNSFKELFEKVSPDSILSYLHEIGLLSIVTHFKSLVSFETIFYVLFAI